MTKKLLLSELNNLQKVGTYTNRHGDTLTMHRNPNDSKHHLLVNKGKVVDYHHGSAKDFHKKLTKDGLQGALHEESLFELSTGTLTKYMIKAGGNRQLHSAQAALGMTRANGPRGEAEVKSALAKNSQKHALKAYNRKVGMDRATKKLVKKPETAGVCEEAQINEISANTLTDYENKAEKSFHSASNSRDKNTLRKRRAGSKLLNTKKSTCEYCGGSGVDNHGVMSNQDLEPCDHCNGRGHVFENYINDLKTVIHNHGGRDLAYQEASRRAEQRLKAGKYNKDKKKLGEETQNLSEATIKEVTKKLEHHGYKKFGDSDRIDHREILSTFHHPELGHLVSVNHRETGKVNSASAMKCTNCKTGEMAPKWGEDHSHVELALRELGHKSYVGFKEEVEQIDEISKQLAGRYIETAKHDISAHAGWSGYEAKGEIDRGDKKPTKARKHHDHKLINRLVGVGRAVEKLTKEEVQIDEVSKSSLYKYINHAAMNRDKHNDKEDFLRDKMYHAANNDEPELHKKFSDAAEKHNKKAEKRTRGIFKATDKIMKRSKVPATEGFLLTYKDLIEGSIKKGRPRKPRHEDGEIVNDPHAINKSKDKGE